jgi:hypothetical protein
MRESDDTMRGQTDMREKKVQNEEWEGQGEA